MIRVLLLLSVSAALTAALKFTDCATNRSNAIITLHQLDLSPSPVLFPGDLSATINLTVNQQINNLFLDTELEKSTLGIWTKIPCVGDTNIGSCQNIDACTILERIINGSSIISQDLGQQIDAILLSALGHNAHCPISPETVSIVNQKLTLQGVPTALGGITRGHYRITIKVKDDVKSTDNRGCIRFEVDFARGVTQPGVG